MNKSRGDDSEGVFIKSYTLLRNAEGEVHSPDEVMELIEVALAADMAGGKAGVFMQSVGGAIVIRNTASVHCRVQRLLQEIGAWRPPSQRFEGGYF